MAKIGRNDPCHCGSGKKYKNCHMNEDSTKTGKNKGILIGFIIALFIVISAMIIYNNDEQSGSSAPGPAPEGKVWSEEHGHWHDK